MLLQTKNNKSIYDSIALNVLYSILKSVKVYTHSAKKKITIKKEICRFYFDYNFFYTSQKSKISENFEIYSLRQADLKSKPKTEKGRFLQ